MEWFLAGEERKGLSAAELLQVEPLGLEIGTHRPLPWAPVHYSVGATSLLVSEVSLSP